MERDDSISNGSGAEGSISLWQRIAAALRGRVQPKAAPLAAARGTANRLGLAAPRMEGIRQRVRDIRQRPPLRVSALRGPQGRPGEEHPAAQERPRPAAVLDPRLQQHLEQFLRLRLPRIEIHTASGADRIARRVGADAVTAGNAIYFRQGAYRPETTAGRALLAHEATHIAWSQGARPRSAAASGAGAEQQEERTALLNEHRYLRRRASVPLTAPLGASQTAGQTPAQASAPAFVKAAMSSREVEETTSAASAQGMQLSEAAVRALKGDLYRMLLEKIRSEFERGA